MSRGASEHRRGAPWSVPVTLQEVPASGRRFALIADEATRAAIANAADLRALPRFEATFDVNRRADGLQVVGQVSATVGQVCVVTLDPIENEIEEHVDLTFVPAASVEVGAVSIEAPEEEDVPEPLVNETIDLGAIATEFLMLGIDPYPRKPEAVFEPPATGEEKEHPFAALAALKRGRENRDG